MGDEQNEGGLNLDEIYDEIGQFGFYQALILCIVAFTATISATSAYTTVFTNAQPDFRCKLPGWANDTYEIQNDYHKSLIDKYIPSGTKNKNDQTCALKVYNESVFGSANQSSFQVKSCNEYVYSKEYYTNTVVTNWDLVCDRETIKSTFTSLYFFGYFAVVIVGLLGDTFGRKIISYIFIGVCTLVTILMAILVNVNSISRSAHVFLYGALRLLIGITSNVYIVGMVLVIELVGPKWRVTASNSFYYSYVLGEFITLIFGYFFKDFRAFYIALAVFMVSFMLYFWIVPESPRFLMLKGRKKEAYAVLARIAKSNKRTLSEATLKNIEASNQKSAKINSVTPEDTAKPKEKNFGQKLLVAFKSGKFRLRLIITMINWFANTFVYDGLSFNIGALGGNPYLNYVYGALVELAGISASHYSLIKFGRKIPYSVCLLLSGISLVCIAFVPTHLPIIATILALIGKFFISFTFNAVYVVTAEIYPTEIRNTAVSFCSAQSRIGGVIAPYVQQLGSIYWFPLPFLIYGVSALLGAITYIIFIPETKNMKLVDKVEDMDISEDSL